MPPPLTRAQLYELVWSEPIVHVAPKYGVSNVYFAKVCRLARVPIPPRGYWTRIKAGKRLQRPPLPSRPPGTNELIYFKSNRPSPLNIDRIEDVLPSFQNNIQELSEFILNKAKKISPVKLRNDQNDPLKLILCIANNILSNFGHRIIRNCRSNEFTSVIGEQKIIFFVINCQDNQLMFNISIMMHERHKSDGLIFSWIVTDSYSSRRIGCELAASLIIAGEIKYRSAQQKAYEHKIAYRAEMERAKLAWKAAIAHQKSEEERHVQNEGAEALLHDATSFDRAQEIRAYVAAAVAVRRVSVSGIREDEFETWCRWALERADALDPLTNGAFRTLVGRD